MVSRETQRDVGAATPKLIGPFNTRQCIFIGIGAVIGFIICAIASSFGVDTFTSFILCLPFSGGVISLGFIHPYDMKPEDYLLQYYVYHMLTPPVRIYSVKTAADIFFEEQEKEEAKLNTGKKKKQGKKAGKKIPLPKPDPEFPMFP